MIEKLEIAEHEMSRYIERAFPEGLDPLETAIFTAVTLVQTCEKKALDWSLSTDEAFVWMGRRYYWEMFLEALLDVSDSDEILTK